MTDLVAFRPEIIRDVHSSDAPVVAKTLGLADRIYRLGFVRKTVILAALAIAWEVYGRWLGNPLLFPTFGQTVEAFWNSVRHAKPFAVGLNCALGAELMRPHIAELSRIADTLVSAYPNAGLPNAMGEYDEQPHETGHMLHEWAERPANRRYRALATASPGVGLAGALQRSRSAAEISRPSTRKDSIRPAFLASAWHSTRGRLFFVAPTQASAVQFHRMSRAAIFAGAAAAGLAE
jgi:hypothetical protein